MTKKELKIKLEAIYELFRSGCYGYPDDDEFMLAPIENLDKGLTELNNLIKNL